MESVTYTIGEADHLSFWKLQFDSSLKQAGLIILAIVVVLAILAALAGELTNAIGVASGALAGMLIVILLARFVLIPIQARKVWRDYALIKEEMTLTMRDVGFTINQASGHVDSKWSQMVAWNENEQVFAMYLNRQLAYIVPKVEVPQAQIDFARDKLIESGLKAKGKPRK